MHVYGEFYFFPCIGSYYSFKVVKVVCVIKIRGLLKTPRWSKGGLEGLKVVCVI